MQRSLSIFNKLKKNAYIQKTDKGANCISNTLEPTLPLISFPVEIKPGSLAHSLTA